MTPIDTAELERLADTGRNRIINRCSADLESIVNGHDPEIHNLNVRVWDRLDRMAVEIEQHFAHRKAGESMNGRAVMTIYACPTPQEITSWAESALRNVPDGSLTRAFMRELIADFADGLSALRATPEADGDRDERA